jgi:predicted AAA+ superfamily ATPase
MRMWIPRALEPQLRQLVATRPVVVLTGARQTGKTSTLRRLFPNHGFVSLDLPSEAELAEHQPAEFLQRHPPPVLLDEIQYAPALFRHLKVAVDARRAAKGRFLLTGSQKSTLMKGVTESLAGRAGLLDLEPLSYAEVLSVLPRCAVEDYIVRGGMPELQADREVEVLPFQHAYLATYLERDVRALTNVGSLRDFERFLRAAALRSGQLLNKAELAKDTGIAPSTANQWLSVLQASGQIAILEPWFSNRTKSLVKTPKLYLADSGLLCALLGVRSAAELGLSPLTGAIWETAVAAELRRGLMNAGRPGELYFWREREREVDFVIHRAGRFVLAEAKWTELPSNRDAANLRLVAAQLPKGSVQRLAVICRCANAYPLGDGVDALPLAEVGRLLE